MFLALCLGCWLAMVQGCFRVRETSRLHLFALSYPYVCLGWDKLRGWTPISMVAANPCAFLQLPVTICGGFLHWSAPPQSFIVRKSRASLQASPQISINLHSGSIWPHQRALIGPSLLMCVTTAFFFLFLFFFFFIFFFLLFFFFCFRSAFFLFRLSSCGCRFDLLIFLKLHLVCAWQRRRWVGSSHGRRHHFGLGILRMHFCNALGRAPPWSSFPSSLGSPCFLLRPRNPFLFSRAHLPCFPEVWGLDSEPDSFFSASPPCKLRGEPNKEDRANAMNNGTMKWACPCYPWQNPYDIPDSNLQT